MSTNFFSTDSESQEKFNNVSSIKKKVMFNEDVYLLLTLANLVSLPLPQQLHSPLLLEKSMQAYYKVLRLT